MKTPVIYSQEELERPSKYIIVTSDHNIDTSLIDTQDAENYVKKYNRRAIIVSAKDIFRESEIEKLNFLYVRNATTPAVKLIDPNGQGYKKVYDTILEKYQNGLIIAHQETLTHEIADQMASNIGNGLDFVVYRQDLISTSPKERSRVNYLRIHFNSDFLFSKDSYRRFAELYGDTGAVGIMLSQYIANFQFNLSQSYFNDNSKLFEERGMEDYIDYVELNRQFAFHVFYDVKKGKVLGYSPEKLKPYLEMLFTAVENKPMFNKAEELSHIFAS